MASNILNFPVRDTQGDQEADHLKMFRDERPHASLVEEVYGDDSRVGASNELTEQQERLALAGELRAVRHGLSCRGLDKEWLDNFLRVKLRRKSTLNLTLSELQAVVPDVRKLARTWTYTAKPTARLGTQCAERS